jgi:hypothetical protein
MKNVKCCSQLSTYFKRHLGRQMSHLSVQTKLETVSSNLHYYVHKQVQLLSLLSMNKCTVLLCEYFLNKASTVTFISISTTYIITFSIYLWSRFPFCVLGLTFAPPIRLNPDDFSTPKLLRITRVYRTRMVGENYIMRSFRTYTLRQV